MNDNEVKELLPWYTNGSLSPEEHAEVETLLSHSAEARQELVFLQELAKQIQAEKNELVSELGWRRLQRNIRFEQKPISALKDWWKPGLAMAMSVVFMMQIGLFMKPVETHSDTQLLSQSFSNLQKNHWIVQVEFKDSSQWQTLTSLIGQLNGRLIDGPSSVGLVRIAVPHSFASAENLLLWLNQQPSISHAEIEGSL